jgi:competence protein ComEC
MAALAALGFALGRRAAALNGLCAAVAVMLILEPDALTDAGLQLSVAATAGLLLLQAPIAARLGALPLAVRHGLATTLAASIPTLPLVIGAFGRLSLISPLANLVAVPLFPPLMVVGVAASVAGAISLDAGRPLAFFAYVLALALRRVVEVSAAVPGAALDLPSGPGSALAAAAVIAAIFLAARHARLSRPRLARPRWWAPPRWRRDVAIGAAALVAVAALGVALALPRGPALRVHALDVGQGDAFLIESDGHYALIDGGPDPSRLVAELGATMPPWKRRIDVVALTHAHVDHGAGLLALFDRFEIGLALEPRGLNDVPLSTLWHQAADRAGVAHREVAAGARVRLGAAALRILAPNDDPKVDVPSLVVRLERGGFAMLFMGDATEQAQADLLLEPGSLGATVYVPPHQREGTQLHHVTVDGLAQWIAWWDMRDASA